ncbi:hypothetical protein O181_094303 [Austropuccinia psidii MF-1]|uniref:Uncharacterized protein n=1 Tax=Austropuccinia psidii MF-1 TaxID=1389203 RepID=A0A9Q3J1U8_9BASI|nr:hypothetical protein [Austropuccinia psidii MF-1]
MMNSWHSLKRFLKGEEIIKSSNRWNQLSSKAQIKKYKGISQQKDRGSKEEAPIASTSKPQANQPPQEGKKTNKKNLKKTYATIYRIPRIQKYSMENVFNIFRALREFKDKEEKIMRQQPFPKR